LPHKPHEQRAHERQRKDGREPHHLPRAPYLFLHGPVPFTPPLRPAVEARVRLCEKLRRPGATALPPLLAISRWRSGDMAAKPRRDFGLFDSVISKLPSVTLSKVQLASLAKVSGESKRSIFHA
jgi:hypothetical protein